MIKIQHIAFDSPLYRDCLELRNKILRIPLGLELSAQDLAEEDTQIHFAALENDLLSACVTFKPVDQHRVKLRQMAVNKHQQGKGVGSALVRFAEGYVRALGFCKIELSARVEAAAFYERLGYSTEGEGFMELGIAHVKMTKSIAMIDSI